MQSISPLFAGSDSIDAAGRVIAVSLLFGILYVASVALVHRGVAPLNEMMAILQEMLPVKLSSRLAAVRLIGSSTAT